MRTSAREYREVVLELLPPQGSWGEEDYLWLTDGSSRLIEFTDGCIEVLPMPTDAHQNILQFLFLAFLGRIRPHGGKVQFAPLRVHIRDRKYREPDLLLLLDREDARRASRYWSGADLVLEVVSEDKPERDLVTKRDDYAEARIPEYWIVNPLHRTITVLTLHGDAYTEHGVFARGQRATSALLADFAVEVDAVFDAE